MNDKYQLIVVFTRYHSEDDEVCAETGRTHAQQLAAELQEAYESHGGMAGNFQVLEPAV